MPKSNTTIMRTPMFEWCVVRCESKSWHHKDMGLRESGLRGQHILTVLGLIVNMTRGSYMTI